MKHKIGTHTFTKTKHSGLDGKTVVGWVEDQSDFQVRATMEGVWFQGMMKMKLSTMAELQDFAELISEAWAEHAKLKPRITTSFNDHEH